LRGELSRKDARVRAKLLLSELGLEKRLNHYPNMLSGGEQQRVTIARALANEPELLLMDEPTGDLDTKNTEYIINLLLTLNITKGITMVMVTHDEYMKQYATRIFNVSDGKINKTQVVKKENREKAIDTLRAQLKQYELGNDGIGVRMAVESKEGVDQNKLSETRAIGDYPFIKYMVNRLNEKEMP